MSEQDIPSSTNDLAILIRGGSGEGKSASMRNLRDQPDWMVLNAEAGKKLPFKNKLQVFNIADPHEVFDAIGTIKESPDDWKGLAIDTASFLMEQYESQYVIGAANGQKAWGDYAQYFKQLMHQHIGQLPVPVLMFSHARSILNESTGEYVVQAAVKGSLANLGMEAYFTTVLSARKVSIKELNAQPFDPEMLTITEDEELEGFKYVFQTRPTKKTMGERIRAPIGLFSREQLYIDNDAQKLLDHVTAYYA